MTDLTAARKIRRLGIVLLVAGLFLIGLMATVTVRMYPSLSHPGIADLSGTTFNGTAAQARDTLRLFALVIAFGIVAAANGLWQIATGRRSLVFAGVSLAVALALAWSAQAFIVG